MNPVLVKPYVRKPAHHPRHTRHLIQELSCIFVGAATVVLLAGLSALAAGEAAWNAFATWLTGPWSLALHGLLFLGVGFHAVAWFAVTPKAMRVQLGERFLPAGLIAGAHYLAWMGISLLILLGGVFYGRIQ